MAEPHVVSALMRKRAEIAGEIEAAEQRLDALRRNLAHIDAVLRLFDAAAEPGAIPAPSALGGAGAGSPAGSCRGTSSARSAPPPPSP